MERKVTRDVRIVFYLSIDMLAGCAAGRTYVVHVKRGSKIHTSSPPLAADEGGKVQVNLRCTFTSTLQRQSDRKYKKKELKVRIEEVCSKAVTTFSYDLSKNIVAESFPERKVVIRERNGSTELYLRLRGAAESLHSQQPNVQPGSNVSFTTYMREAGAAASLAPREPAWAYGESSTPSIAVDDYVSVIESLTEATSERRSEDRHSEAKETGVDEGANTGGSDKDAARRESALQALTAAPRPSTESTSNELSHKNSQGSEFARSPVAVAPTGKDAPPPPPRVPSKRILVSSTDPVHAAIKQICGAVRRGEGSDEGLQKVRDAPKGARLALNFYVRQTGETLERFVVGFLAHLVLEVCQETRHIGSWLNLLTHVIYGSLLHASHPCNVCEVERMTLRVAELRDFDFNAFTGRAKSIVRQFAARESAPSGVELFWLAGLDYCARTLALLSIHPVQRVIDNFSTLLPGFEGGRISMEERLVSATGILCSHLHLLLCDLLSQTDRHEVYDIRVAPPLYRIILVGLMTKLFSNLVTVIIEYTSKQGHLHPGGESYIALKIFNLIVSWAKGHFLLSVLSPVLMPFVVYCDSVLLPQELLRNRDYRLYVERFLPLSAANSGAVSNPSPWSVSPALPETVGGSVAFSPFALLTEFTAGGCREACDAETSLWTLTEVLGGDKGAAGQVLAAEEVFPETGFNGTPDSLYDPRQILPLLLHTVRDSSS
ncbi:putative AGP2beta-2 [Trypanosoma conorhini]|uniref:Putative AGP2beta-2 n=1 Tax=Trypanosoma conorhini TaxID=83891 RepID=A0A3R7KNA2_9TRYP|nr:putative AGP2beta-2 [Trypanosoma conorhini]RNF10794.1 putative AGP2beta-2 [Trypanosoma conorhini]